ncbi:PiggyBac transposable element-derived protein 4 [Anthophora retusa]
MSVHDSESDNSEVIFARRRYRVPIYSSSEEEEESVEEWSDPSGNQPNIRPFVSPSGFVMDDISLRSDAEVEHCYELFVPDTLVEEIVVQTNLYASQVEAGSLRSNRRGNPPQVISKQLKRGKAIAKQNKKGITILKWKDKRDILVLSTKHSSEMVNVQSRSGNKLKPKIIVDYNRGKATVNLSDQMNGYNSPLRRSLKWYRKLAIELLLNTAVLNSFILFKNITTKRISITEFRKKLAVYLTNCKEAEVPSSSIATSKKRHNLQTQPGRVSAVRKCCKSCYEENAAQSGRKIARNLTKQVITFCDTCEGQPFLCLPCFNKIH